MDKVATFRRFYAALLFCICIVDVNGQKHDDGVQEMEFYWRREKWKACMKMKSCGEPGIRRRALSCVNFKGEKVPSRKCDRGKRPRRKEFCVVKECIRQTKFSLELEPWQDCKAEKLLSFEVKGVVNMNGTIEHMIGGREDLLQLGATWKRTFLDYCGSFDSTLIYVKRRNATCIAHWSDRARKVETTLKHCLDNAEDKPHFIKLCSIGCKQQCSVGLWAVWESSPFLGKGSRFRRRQITFFPYQNNNTKICPPLIDFHAVKEESTEDYAQVQYELSEWGECKRNDRLLSYTARELQEANTVIGMKHRTFKCAISMGARINCDKNASYNITKSQLCILPRDCQVSEWSNWSRCEAVYLTSKIKQKFRQKRFEVSYEQRRKRIIKSAQLSGGGTCPHLQETRYCEPAKPPVDEQGLITLENTSYVWFVGSYSKCVSNRKHCQSGTKQRSVFCVRRGDEQLTPVGAQFCAHVQRPGEVAFCRSQCRDVCALGEWGSWSSCTADCTADTTGVIMGTHYRVRRVLQYSGDPNSCPDYAESRPCTLQKCISWSVGTQTICLMDNIHRACGNGKSHRAVYCMNARGQQVNERFCSEKMPQRSLPCHVPCSDDCVVGTWSSWGSCESQCSLNGTQTASYRTRRKRILANPGWSGRPCPDASELVQRESCLGESCGTYKWKIGTWGSCRKGQHGDGKNCVLGVTHRRISCINEAGVDVNENLCSSFVKPRGKRECRLCAEDCVVTAWSDWSDCPIECTFRKSRFYRRRQRYIVRPNRDGGRACPEMLIQTEQCDSCNDYEWKLGNWSDCESLRHGDCRGLKTRQVICVRKSESTLQPDGYCLHDSRKPKEYTSCSQSNCKDLCILTQWSNWGKCSRNCGSGFRRRTRDVIGNRADCKATTKMTEERQCNTHFCGQYSLRIGKWSPCYASGRKSHCGTGEQWRNVTCFKTSGQEAALDYCIEELYDGKLTLELKRKCTKRCALDCKLSPWTGYSPCSRKCGSGIKTRFRTVVQKATHGGQVCAAEEEQITETIPCIERQCYNFVWGADPWSVCKVINQTRGHITKCGTGIQTRLVYCTDIRYSGPKRIVNDSFCDAKERPLTREPCTLYCPRDCVVGEWTSWSKCSSVCPKPGHKRRERTVLRYPAHNGNRCPALEEQQTCNLNHCLTHHWRPTKWSSCLFYEADTSCGIGRQRRLVDCIRNDGKIVHPLDCRMDGRRIPTLLRMCAVPCPKNCQISEWGAWSSCQSKCNLPSIQRRNRFILAHAQNGGQSCLQSETLQEFRSCPMKPCYKVEVGQWETCRPYFDQACGFGVRRRYVYCVRDDGKIVDEMHCPDIVSGKLPAEMSCEIPCQGDCIVSTWSLWSSCFAACTINNQSLFEYGTRIRTRQILKEAKEFGDKCPVDLMERERCFNQKCFTFSWKTSPYVEKKRDVWCERSDGLRVSNGCRKGLRPSKTQTCRPKCNSVSHSYCNTKTVCVCKTGFVPIFSSHGHLIHCLSNSNPFRNDTNEVIKRSSSNSKKDTSWVADLPLIIWVVIGVCFVYLLLFLAIVIVYTRRRRGTARQRTETVDVGTLTNPERIPLKERSTSQEKPKGHERTASKTSFATSSGRGSTLSTIGDHDDGEQWPEPPDDIVSEFIRQHLKNFNKSSICSTFTDESVESHEGNFTSRGASFDASGTL